MKILVLGGTGAMGIHVVNILAQRGHDLYVTSRKEHKACQNNIQYIVGNARQFEFICGVLQERFDIIIDFMYYSELEFQKRYKMFLDNAQQYIFLSSARVCAESEEPISEKSKRLLDADIDKDYLQQKEYALEKAREEDLLVNSGRKNWTIIRPYITYSDNRLQLGVLEKEEWLYRALKGRTIVFSKDIAEKYTTLTYGYDVAVRIIDVVGNRKCYGEIYQITTNQAIRWQEVLEIYLAALEQVLGKRPKVKMLENADQFVHLSGNYYQIHYDRLYNRSFDSKKIEEVAKTKENYTNVEEGLKQCLRNFVNQELEFSKINWSLQAFFDRQTQEHTLLKEIEGLEKKLIYLVFRYVPIVGHGIRIIKKRLG